jgi:hypothetical protein
MLLRAHPLMTYKGIRSWPPAWLWRGGNENTHPEGEVGILKDVMLSTITPCTCLLIMEHCGAQYIGALLLSDPAFYSEICRVLFQNCGKTIREIGDIDLSHTF